MNKTLFIVHVTHPSLSTDWCQCRPIITSGCELLQRGGKETTGNGRLQYRQETGERRILVMRRREEELGGFKSLKDT